MNPDPSVADEPHVSLAPDEPPPPQPPPDTPAVETVLAPSAEPVVPTGIWRTISGRSRAPRAPDVDAIEAVQYSDGSVIIITVRGGRTSVSLESDERALSEVQSSYRLQRGPVSMLLASALTMVRPTVALKELTREVPDA